MGSSKIANCDLFLFAGEKSGDFHGAELLSALQNSHPELAITAVAGPEMRKYPIDPLVRMESFQVMGFIDVFKALPRLYRLFYHIGKAILNLNPRAVILIDYPGFNLRLAKYLRNKGYKGKIIHYICPTVWAWGKKRIDHMANTLDLLLTILPFEKSYFSHTKLPVHYIGNPLCNKIASHKTTPLFPDKKTIALFPGSRRKEIERNLPLMIQAAKNLLKTHPDLLFPISIANGEHHSLISSMIGNDNHFPFVDCDKRYDLMQSSQFAIATSGTITLELALSRLPTIVVYKTSTIDKIIAYDLLRIRLPHYCLVNIILNQRLFPELYGPDISAKKIEEKARYWLEQSPKLQTCRKQCSEIQKELGDKKCAKEAIATLTPLLKETSL